MDERSLLLISFFGAQLLLIIALVWTYSRLRSSGSYLTSPFNRLLVLAMFAMLPVLLAWLTLPGILRQAEIDILIPDTGDVSTFPFPELRDLPERLEDLRLPALRIPDAVEPVLSALLEFISEQR